MAVVTLLVTAGHRRLPARRIKLQVILNGQDRVLAILDNFASKDMPGRQRHIQDCVDQILAKVDPKPAAS